MKVTIIEPSASGHRLYYVRIIAEALAGECVEWITTPDAAASREAQVHLSTLVDSGALQCIEIDSWVSHRKLLRAADKPGDIVIIPDGDRWLAALLGNMLLTVIRPRRARYRLLCLRPPDFRAGTGERAVIRAVTKSLLIRTIAILNTRRRAAIVFSLVDSFGFSGDRISAGTSPVADPVFPRDIPSRVQARRLLGIDDDVLVVGLLGVIDQRKNPQIVAAGCVQAFRGGRGLLLVAGQIRMSVVESAQAWSGLQSDQLELADRYLSEYELGAAAAACDVVALLYENHASASGMLSLAAQAGAAVITPKNSRLSAVANAGGFGVESSFTAEGVARSLNKVARERRMLSSAALKASARLGTTDFISKLTE